MPARCAILVDAAFVRASAGELLFGSHERARLSWGYEGLATAIADAVAADAGPDRELLRTYWYDGAPNRVPTPEQRRLGQRASVKLRLGRIVGGHQKGIDPLIVLDLVKLATTGAVDTVYLLSGDDDLTEAVREAQAAGVRVVLAGASTSAPRHAETLVMEADDVLLWGPELWRPHVSRAAAEPHAGGSTVGPRAQAARPPAAAVGPEAVQTFGRVGYAFANRWLEEASEAEVERIVRARPRIPGDLDARLLWDTSAGRDLSEGERVALREGFWRAVDGDRAGGPGRGTSRDDDISDDDITDDDITDDDITDDIGLGGDITDDLGDDDLGEDDLGEDLDDIGLDEDRDHAGGASRGGRDDEAR